MTNVEKLSGANAVGYLLMVMAQKFGEVPFTLEEQVGVTIGLGTVLTFLVNRIDRLLGLKPQE